jgi:hypothetical protein
VQLEQEYYHLRKIFDILNIALRMTVKVKCVVVRHNMSSKVEILWAKMDKKGK